MAIFPGRPFEWERNALACFQLARLPAWQPPLPAAPAAGCAQDVGAPLPASAPPPTLRLHLLGATMDCEAVCLAKYEEVLHCLPGVQRLELALVGPELPAAGQAPGGAGRERATTWLHHFGRVPLQRTRLKAGGMRCPCIGSIGAAHA